MYKNHEGYKDPTAGEAINRAEKKCSHSGMAYNLKFKGYLTYELINCMSEDIKSLYGLCVRS